MIKAVHMNILRGFLVVRRMDTIPNARIRELYGVAKGMDERIDESIIFGLIILKE